MTHPPQPPTPMPDEAASHPITLTLANRPAVIAWLAHHGLNAAPPGDPDSELVLISMSDRTGLVALGDAVLVHMPDRTGVVALGETLDIVGDTVIVGRPEQPRDMFPAHPNPAPDGATPPMFGPLRRPETPPAPALGISPIPPELPARVRLIEPPEVFTPLDEFEVACSTLGGIPGVDPWHDLCIVTMARRFCERFPDTRKGLAIICPRRRDITRTLTPEELDAQVLWEYTQALIPADVGANLFWFPASTVEYPQPTSLVEYGDARGSRLRYAIGAHPLYHRRDVLRVQVPLDGHRLHDRLDHTIEDVVGLLGDVYAMRADA